MAEIITVVKVPIAQIEEWLRSLHDLPEKLDSYKMEADALILNFKDAPSLDNLPIGSQPCGPDSVQPINNVAHKRRSHKRRNRMRTRGWPVIASIVNSKNQRCSIYKPFVDALKGKQMTSDEQKKIVENILKSNRNKPTMDSVQYFLENTLEYLKGVEQ